MPFTLAHATRTQVFTALFDFIKKAVPPDGAKWNTQSQYLQQWDNVPAANQPALYLVRGTQTAEQKHVYGETKWHWRASLWIYFRTEGLKTKNTYPDILTDQFLDSLEQLFQTDPPYPNRVTLGGLVQNVWIDGTIFTEPGLVDGQAILIIPLSILL